MHEPKRRLLIALAHPDDESFGMAGTIAKYENEGAEVYLICATNGDVGMMEDKYLDGYESIAHVRLAELECAAQILGLTRLYAFGYRDSGMPGSPDNDHPDSLVAADVDEVVRRVTEVIREVHPQVVVTFDPYGGYGHPDHLRMHEAAVGAFQAAPDPSRFPDRIGRTELRAAEALLSDL
jgi:LmbE family N-acetylglucosaminyl deacetylase